MSFEKNSVEKNENKDELIKSVVVEVEKKLDRLGKGSGDFVGMDEREEAITELQAVLSSVKQGDFEAASAFLESEIQHHKKVIAEFAEKNITMAFMNPDIQAEISRLEDIKNSLLLVAK